MEREVTEDGEGGDRRWRGGAREGEKEERSKVEGKQKERDQQMTAL